MRGNTVAFQTPCTFRSLPSQLSSLSAQSCRLTHALPATLARSRVPLSPGTPTGKPSTTMTAGLDWSHIADHAITLLATRGDIGPLTNINLESTGLVAAIGGGSLIAGLVILIIVRF